MKQARVNTLLGALGAFGILAMASITMTSDLAAHETNNPTGQDIYQDKCIHCHSARGWGTRVLTRRVPEGQAELTLRRALPAAFTAIVVRQGIGSMPPFTPTELSDEEIAEVARWLEER